MKTVLGVSRSRTALGVGGARLRTRLTMVSVALVLGGLLTAPLQAQVIGVATDADVAAAIKGGQQYLFNQFHDVGDGTGYWADYDNLTGTATAVAALVESGKMSDPAYRAMIDKGIAYIKTQVKTDGGIYAVSYSATYETGLALVALGLYGQATSTDAAYKAVVQNAVDYLKSYQNIEGSTAGGDYGPAGQATSTNTTGCDPAVAEYYGGWGYSPDNNKCSTEGDLSNTQFAVMGLWYGSRYLGLTVDTAPWAKALLTFLKHRQDPDGGFYVYSGGSYKAIAANGGGIWSLAMIGQTDAKKAPTEANTMLQNAVSWYANNYTWNYPTAYMYAVYGNAKALTATLGTSGKVGANNWATDMKNEVVFSSHRISVPAVSATATTPAAPAYDSWNSGGGLDPKVVAQTSWVLTSLAFASTSTESTEKLLAQEDALDNLVRGLLTLHTTGGVTISSASRGNVAAANLGKNVVLPVGSVLFTLNNVAPDGSSTVLSITPPVGALDPTNPNSFVKADGTLKAGLNWFKIVGGDWKGQASVPISVDLAKGVILVTLKDGGPEDADGLANGKIVDPGAPGFGETTAVVVEPTPTPTPETVNQDDSDWFGCSVGNGQPDPTLFILLAGGAAFMLRRRRQ